jgi:hypothetical protein
MTLPTWDGKRALPIVSACMTREGLPAFALNTVEVTAEEVADGIHIYLVEADLLEAGYEEPFVHFPEDEAPAFLHPAVRDFLVIPQADTPILTFVKEDR